MKALPRSSTRAGILILTLLLLALISVIVLGLLTSVTFERQNVEANYQQRRSFSLAMLGFHAGVAQLRSALGPWDDPFNNFCGGTPRGGGASAPPNFFWTVSPGIITRWPYSDTPPTNYPLFSTALYGDTQLANLNLPLQDGSHPIMGGANPPAIQVAWANVLQNPSQQPSSSNPIIGRYAFWIDDECAKININTADGTLKYQTHSLGLGSPSEVSLQALSPSLDTPTATNIVYLARSKSFMSPREILRTPGTSTNLFTDNVANITTCSRSPELNIFGQPRMAILPMLEDSGWSSTYSYTNLLNGLTLQPLKEIYPVPSQLPPYQVSGIVYPTYWGTIPNGSPRWPLAFREEMGYGNEGGCGGLNFGPGTFRDYAGGPEMMKGDYCWVNGLLLADYLAGTNSLGQPVTWPSFADASSTGFAGKYSTRQIDSIVAQIMTFGARLNSPDYPFSSDLSGQEDISTLQGRRIMTGAMLFPGWLSGQWVSGIGRLPVATSVLMQFTTQQGNSTRPPTDSGSAPSLLLNIWTEWWLPSGYLGGNKVVPLYLASSAGMGVGIGTGYPGEAVINLNDEAVHWGVEPSPLPETNFTTPSYWGNQLLTNNQGIDFEAHAKIWEDPDQVLAAQYHDPWAWTVTANAGHYTYPGTNASYTNTQGYYVGAGIDSLSAVFYMPYPEGDNESIEWSPGEIRCCHNNNGDHTFYMGTSAAGTNLLIGGGITLDSHLHDNGVSDGEFVPLESMRGLNAFGNTANQDYENWTNSAALPYPGVQGILTVRDRVTNSVIPISANIPVPVNGDGSGLGNTVSVLSRVTDPLVASFPGDWQMTSSTINVPPTTMEYQKAGTGGNAGYTEYKSDSGFDTNLPDPDSYWAPQADAGFCRDLSDVAPQTIIPRVARFPSVGYLQYLRTGVIPDDESLDYYPQPGEDSTKYQHGTPFRLLSFAPSSETDNQKTTRNSAAAGTSQSYPDWAMLDLLYVPSLLSSYGSPYGYYNPPTSSTWTGYGSSNVLAAYSTGGGSTPGRINPNGCVIYTTNAEMPVPGVTRTVPLQAVFQGLMVNQSLNQNPTNAPNPNPGYSGGSSVDATGLSAAIAAYINSNGPLKMPAELSNVPEIAALRPNGVNTTANNPTRNDLIRQVVGALTTQSNVFSVWTMAQAIQKIPSHSQYGILEPGDLVLSQTRIHFIVERYLDQGTNPGSQNASTAGPDGVVGTYDDLTNSANRPYCPRYLYRVLSAEEL